MRATPNLKKVASGVQEGLKLTPTITRYFMGTRGSEPYYPEDVIEIITSQLAGQGRVRHGSFSASAMDTSCKRKSIFQYLGATQDTGRDEMREAILSNLFLDGHWRHLRWQAALLEMGLIDTIEHPMVDKRFELVGTADGLNVEEGYGVEIKGTNERQFGILKHMKRPLDGHVTQVQTYMMLTGYDEWFVLYECKNTNDWKEFRLTPDLTMVDEIKRHISQSRNAISNAKLPRMIDECTTKDGQYKRCPYSQVCERTKTWPKDQDVSVSKVDLPTGRWVGTMKLPD